MVEDCQYVAGIIYVECGEGSEPGVHFQKLISFFTNVRPYFDAMTTSLMIALSWSRHAPGDNMPRIPAGYHDHSAEVFKRYAPD